jgi:hypothetical protein
MVHLSLSIEKNQILIAEIDAASDRFSLVRAESFPLKHDPYLDALDKGSPQVITDLSKQIAEKLAPYSESELTLSLNMGGVKHLIAQFNRNLTDEEFEEECDWEAAAFLREPDDYSRETLKLYTAPDAPFESHLLIFLPKRFLTRLQMLFLPSGKSLAAVEFSHFAVQRLYANANQHVLLELDSAYIAISKLMNGEMSLFKYWVIEAETDVAYFAVNELKAIGGMASVAAFGAMATDSVLDFIKSATGKPIQPLQAPPFVKNATPISALAPFLPTIGCAIQPSEVAS